MSQSYTYLIQVDTNGNAVLPQLANNANKADASLRKVGKGAKGRFTSLKTGVESVNTSLRGVGKSAQTGFSNLNRNIRSSTSMMSKLRGMAAGLGLTLSAGMAVSGVIGIGAGFEKSMSNVQALSNATKKEMVGLTKAARDAGASTAFTARESADAMGYLALAGYKADQQIKALPATLDLAAAGSIGLARSADIATNILSQYRMNAKDTNVVVDQLAFTQSRFNTNIEEASDAMNYFGPTAAAMKISLAESNATIGLLANNGLKGSLATRALGTSIVRLTKPTKQMRTVMDRLNLSFFDSKGQFVGMAGMVEQLNTKMQGMTDKQKQSALATIFGAEAIQEMNILLAEGSDKIRYWTDELENAKGTAKRMAETKLDNLAGDFQILKSSSQEVALSLYDEIQPALRDITQEATLFIRSLDTKKVGVSLRKTIYTLRSGIVWLKDHKRTIVNLGKALLILKGVTLAYNAGARLSRSITAAVTLAKWGYTAATRGAAVATKTFNTAVKANPLGLLLSGLTAVIGAMTLFRDRTNEAANAQRNLNNEEIEGQIIRDDALATKEGTDKDAATLTRDISQRQLKKIKSSAENRIEKLEDELLTMQVNRVQLQKDNQEELSDVDNAIKRLKGKSSLSDDEQLSLNRMIIKRSQIRREGGLIQDFGAKTSDGLSEKEAREYLQKNKNLLVKAKGLIKPEKNGNYYKNFTKSSPPLKIDTGTSENIISGGSQQKVINIKIEKFQDAINFNIQGQLDELRNNVDEMRAMINEQFMRVLNSANQMTN